MLKTKKVIGILAWMVFLIIPIPMNYLYAYIYRVAARFYGLFFIWIYVYAFIVYVGIGIILGAIGFSRERKFSGCWHISPVYMVSGLLMVLFSVLLNTPLAPLLHLFPKLFDPFYFWTIGAGFLIISAWRKTPEPVFSFVFSGILLLFPVLLRIVLPFISKMVPWNSVAFRILYFLYGGFLATSLLYRERKKLGKWRVNICRIVISGIALLLTCCFIPTVYIFKTVITEFFYIWPTAAGFLLIGAWYKKNIKPMEQESAC